MDEKEKPPVRPSLAWYDEVAAPQQPSDVDLTLARTQSVRSQLIRETLVNTDSLDLLLDGGDRAKLFQKLLSDADKQALTLKRISADEGIANTQATAKRQLEILFTDPRVGQLSKDLVAQEVPIRREAPQLPDEFSSVEAIAGEMQDGVSHEGYEAFYNRMAETMIQKDD